MYQMTEEERAERSRVKAVHAAVRAAMAAGHKDPYRKPDGSYHGRGHAGRHHALAWGFMRGFPYRRIERSHRVQMLEGSWPSMAKLDCRYRQLDGQWFLEHNMPSEGFLFDILKQFLPEVRKEDVAAWIRDMSGAVPPPPPRPKRRREEVQPPAAA